MPARHQVLPLLVVLLAGCGGLARNENAQGVRLYQQGNYLGAVNHFQQSLARQPGNPDTFYNLGATYHQQSKLFGRPADAQAAEQYYHLCLARNPSHEACQRGLAVLLVEQQRGDEAIGQLNAWARSPPTNPAPHIELARLAADRHPGLRIMFITGFAAVALKAAETAPPGARVLAKPVHLRELVVEVERMLAA